MQCLQLITITDDYLPLAGSGHNTIRKLDGKYQGLQIGDNVVMFHTADPNTVELVPQTIELLRVSAIAIGTIDTICTHHGPRNNAWRLFEEISKFQQHILSFYPVPDDEERGVNAQFCAIYF